LIEESTILSLVLDPTKNAMWSEEFGDEETATGRTLTVA
jgi:hypothetical protein